MFVFGFHRIIEELDTRRQSLTKSIADLTVETISPQQMKNLSYYLNNWNSIEFDDKRKAADIVITTIRATSDHVEIEWKIWTFVNLPLYPIFQIYHFFLILFVPLVHWTLRWYLYIYPTKSQNRHIKRKVYTPIYTCLYHPHIFMKRDISKKSL